MGGGKQCVREKVLTAVEHRGTKDPCIASPLLTVYGLRSLYSLFHYAKLCSLASHGSLSPCMAASDHLDPQVLHRTHVFPSDRHPATELHFATELILCVKSVRRSASTLNT